MPLKPAPMGVLILAGNGLGRPEDMPLRSKDYLNSADVLLFESDRGARLALKTAGLHRSYEIWSEHAESLAWSSASTALSAGNSVLYMSDQGVPTLADPGRDLVRLATSFRRSSLISAMWSSFTQGLAADATARMPPHQPVPMIAMLTLSMCSVLQV